MTRKVAIAFETTGLDFDMKKEVRDKIFEIGAVEIIDNQLTGRSFHVFINPQKPIPAHITEMTGVTNASLSEEKVFSQVYQDFLNFIEGADLVMHSPFVFRALRSELVALDKGFSESFIKDNYVRIDTLSQSLKLKNKIVTENHRLNTLCQYFSIKNPELQCTSKQAERDAIRIAKLHLKLEKIAHSEKSVSFSDNVVEIDSVLTNKKRKAMESASSFSKGKDTFFKKAKDETKKQPVEVYHLRSRVVLK